MANQSPPASYPRPVPLSEREPFARGRKRLVYEHPDDPALVIKVFRPKYNARPAAWQPWAAARRHYVCVIMVLREVRQHLEAGFEGGALPDFVPRIRGLVDTDVGLGMVVDAVRGRDGSLAPTLKSMIEAGRIDDAAWADLERFCTAVEASRLVVGDMHAGNVVHAHDARGSRFMLVDGLGDKTWVPLLAMSRHLAARARRRKTRRLLDAVRARRAQGVA